MGKQAKPKKPDNFGKGKVTPVQVAFIVDCYLADNGYSETRSSFRAEASTLISRTTAQEAPKSLLSLGAMLDEYICLKEQKVMMDQERVRLEQEKARVQTLLQGMQGVMNAYNSGVTATAPPLAAVTTAAGVPQLDHYSGSSAGCRVYNTPNTMPVSVPTSQNMEPASFYTPMSNQVSTSKRKDKMVPENQPSAKKSRTKPPAKKLPTKGTNNPSQPNNASSIQNHDPQCSLVKSTTVQGSSVAKCLFDNDKPLLSPPSNSPSPKTPPRQVSSQGDKSNSSAVKGTNKNNTPEEITPSHCTVISSERLTVSPDKHITYTVERSRCVVTSPAKAGLRRSSSKREHVKGRLDFDGSDEMVNDDKQITYESGQDLDLYDTDLPNLDLLGADFSFSELLVDLDLGDEGMGFSCEPTFSADNVSGSSHESGDGNLGTNQVMSEYSSTVKVISEDNNLPGAETKTTVKAITKCVRIISPTKSQ